MPVAIQPMEMCSLTMVPETVPLRTQVGPVTSMVPLNLSPSWVTVIVNPPLADPHCGSFCQLPSHVPVIGPPMDPPGGGEALGDGAGEAGVDESMTAGAADAVAGGAGPSGAP